MSEGLREFLLIGELGVRVYGWLYNAEYRQYCCVQRVYTGVHNTRLVRCCTSVENPSNRLVMRNVRLYTRSGSIFLINSFQLCLDFSGQRICCKAEKRKQGHCSPQLPATIRAPFRQIATFSFFKFGVGSVVIKLRHYVIIATIIANCT